MFAGSLVVLQLGLIHQVHQVLAALTPALGSRSNTERTNCTSSLASLLPKRRALIAESLDQPACTRRTYVATAYLVIPRSLIREISFPKYWLICFSMVSFIHRPTNIVLQQNNCHSFTSSVSLFRDHQQCRYVANRRLHAEVLR